MAQSIHPEAYNTAARGRGVAARIESLKATTASPNWDGERGAAISPQKWEAILELCEQVRLCEHVPRDDEPFISPCGDGSIHLTWRRGQDRLTIEYFSPEHIAWSRRTAAGREYGRLTDVSLVVRSVASFFYL